MLGKSQDGTELGLGGGGAGLLETQECDVHRRPPIWSPGQQDAVTAQ